MAIPVPIVPPVVLGRTGLRSTRLGLGTAAWPAHVSPGRAAEALRAAFDLGIRHLDCAAKYHTEAHVGRALRDVGAPADLVVATKVCAYFDEDLNTEFVSYNPAAAQRSVERSLRLLGRERLEIVYIHDPVKENLPLISRRGGVLDVLCALKDQGLIAHLGMASGDHRSLQWAVEHGAFDVVQGFHVNTLLNRSGRTGVYAEARARGIGICDSGPYAGFLLATGPVPGRATTTLRLPPKCSMPHGDCSPPAPSRAWALPMPRSGSPFNVRVLTWWWSPRETRTISARGPGPWICR